MEVEVSTGLQVVPQPDENTYHMSGGPPDHPVFAHLDQSDPLQAKSQGRPRAIWVLAGIAALCLVVALGAGLGIGLATQHKSSSSRYGYSLCPLC